MDEQKLATMTRAELAAGTKNDAEKLISLQQDWWIDYCALGGLITFDGFDVKTDESGEVEVDYNGRPKTEVMQKMTVTEFAEKIHVDRSTLARWRKTIPNFYGKVYERRAALFGARESQLFNRLYLIAMSGNGQPSVAAARTLLGHFSKLKLPTQPTEIKNTGNSWAELLERKHTEAIEGEVVDGTGSTNT
jgi:hypothetical protein